MNKVRQARSVNVCQMGHYVMGYRSEVCRAGPAFPSHAAQQRVATVADARASHINSARRVCCGDLTLPVRCAPRRVALARFHVDESTTTLPTFLFHVACARAFVYRDRDRQWSVALCRCVAPWQDLRVVVSVRESKLIGISNRKAARRATEVEMKRFGILLFLIVSTIGLAANGGNT